MFSQLQALKPQLSYGLTISFSGRMFIYIYIYKILKTYTMGWGWINNKDTNYYTRLRLINKVKKYVRKYYEYNEPVNLVKPVVFTYAGGRVLITAVEFYKYYHKHFQQTKTYIRVHLDNGEFVHLDKLRSKHLLGLVKQVLG